MGIKIIKLLLCTGIALNLGIGSAFWAIYNTSLPGWQI